MYNFAMSPKNKRVSHRVVLLKMLYTENYMALALYNSSKLLLVMVQKVFLVFPPFSLPLPNLYRNDILTFHKSF